MAEALPGEGHDPAAFAAVAKEYVALLRQHILKENQVLFPLADAVLSADDDFTAMARFQTASSEQCECVHATFEAALMRWESAINEALHCHRTS